MSEQFKIVLVGNSGVGKTSLINFLRLGNPDFHGTKPTVGVSFANYKMEVPGEAPIHCLIWDTAGQERFRAITAAYYRGARGVVIVYDMTCRKSFEDVKGWLDEVRSNGDDDKLVLLLGNKDDLSFKRVVTQAEAVAFAEENRIGYVEASACTGRCVQLAFNKLLFEVNKAAQAAASHGGAGADDAYNVALGDDAAARRATSCC